LRRRASTSSARDNSFSALNPADKFSAPASAGADFCLLPFSDDRTDQQAQKLVLLSSSAVRNTQKAEQLNNRGHQ
jgi:hypothetical protein